MNRFLVSSTLCLLAGSATVAEAQFWNPEPALVAKVDAKVAKAKFTGFDCPAMDIQKFSRSYGGFTDAKGRRVIVGQLTSLKEETHPEPGIHIVSNPITIADGGCEVAKVWFDAATLNLIQASWGGR